VSDPQQASRPCRCNQPSRQVIRHAGSPPPIRQAFPFPTAGKEVVRMSCQITGHFPYASPHFRIIMIMMIIMIMITMWHYSAPLVTRVTQISSSLCPSGGFWVFSPPGVHLQFAAQVLSSTGNWNFPSSWSLVLSPLALWPLPSGLWGEKLLTPSVKSRHA